MKVKDKRVNWKFFMDRPGIFMAVVFCMLMVQFLLEGDIYLPADFLALGDKHGILIFQITGSFYDDRIV